MLSKKTRAVPTAVSEDFIWMKWTCLLSRSTMVVMESKKAGVFGRCVIMSIAIDPHIRLGSSSGSAVTSGLERTSFACWHVLHPAQYAVKCRVMIFQWKPWSRPRVLKVEKCPAPLESCAALIMSQTFQWGAQSLPSYNIISADSV